MEPKVGMILRCTMEEITEDQPFVYGEITAVLDNREEFEFMDWNGDFHDGWFGDGEFKLLTEEQARKDLSSVRAEQKATLSKFRLVEVFKDKLERK